MSQPTCAERIDAELERTVAVLCKLWDLYLEDPDAYDDDYGHFTEYHLDYSWQEQDGKNAGYWCYLLSTGGPHDEFRFYPHQDGELPYIEYFFADWYDGATHEVTGEDRALLCEIWDFFNA